MRRQRPILPTHGTLSRRDPIQLEGVEIIQPSVPITNHAFCEWRPVPSGQTRSLSPIEMRDTLIEKQRSQWEERAGERLWRQNHLEVWNLLPSPQDLERNGIPLDSPVAKLITAVDSLHKAQQEIAAMLQGLLLIDQRQEERRDPKFPIAPESLLENSVLATALLTSITEVEQSLDSLTTLLLETWPALLECPKSNARGYHSGLTKEAFAVWLEQSLNATMLN